MQHDQDLHQEGKRKREYCLIMGAQLKDRELEDLANCRDEQAAELVKARRQVSDKDHFDSSVARVGSEISNLNLSLLAYLPTFLPGFVSR